jgi:glutathione S-transferase
VKLRFAPASPFARKVRIVARETGTIGRIEETAMTVSPVSPNADLARENPLVKVPSLVTDEGDTLYDSRVICEYLDTLHGGPKLFSSSGRERFTALRRQALADGMLDAAVLCRYEIAVRPEALRWPEWIAGQKKKVLGGLDAFEAEAQTWNDEFDIGRIAAACAVSYLDFRYADWNWRAGRPRLAAWYQRIADRPSMVSTRPA